MCCLLVSQNLSTACGSILGFVASDRCDTLEVSCLAETPRGPRLLFVNSGGSEVKSSAPGLDWWWEILPSQTPTQPSREWTSQIWLA